MSEIKSRTQRDHEARDITPADCWCCAATTRPQIER